MQQFGGGKRQVDVDDPFADFVRAHSRSLFGTAYLLTGSGEAAEELLQDTLVALYPNWRRVEAAQAPLAYVRRAVCHRFVSLARRPAARDVGVWEVPDTQAPGDLAQLVVDRHWVWQLLGQLSGRQRTALVLRYFHDLPDEEIARCLHCRLGTVRSLISRGLASMRDESTRSAQPGGGR